MSHRTTPMRSPWAQAVVRWLGRSGERHDVVTFG